MKEGCQFVENDLHAKTGSSGLCPDNFVAEQGD